MEIQALKDRLHTLEQVIETMNCGLIAEDLEGTILFANARLLGWLGYRSDEVVGRPIYELVPSELRELVEEDIRAAGEGDLRARLLAARRKDSTTFPVVTIPQLLRDADGRIEGYFSVVVDLGAVLTARRLGSPKTVDLRSTLHRIALELESISLAAPAVPGGIPLHHPELRELSPRELEVLSKLVAGDRVQSIAEQLHISQHTVRNHLKSMYRKLGVGTQAELIASVRSLAEGGDGGSDEAAPAQPTS